MNDEKRYWLLVQCDGGSSVLHSWHRSKVRAEAEFSDILRDKYWRRFDWEIWSMPRQPTMCEMYCLEIDRTAWLEKNAQLEEKCQK